MLIIIKEDFKQLSCQAATIVARALQRKPDIVLGLPTGGTPLGMYRELIRLHQEEGLDFSRATTFNLDEYLGLSPDDPHSYSFYMHNSFFQHVNVNPRNIHIPDGSIQQNLEDYCAEYERAIRQAGGIDLMICGIGKSGHIGFNEPSSSFASRTRIKTLTLETIQENQKHFANGEKVPECVITMGIGTILESRRILLLAAGSAKAPAVARAIEGPLSASISASALQLHPDVTTVLDDPAAAGLAHLDYYRRVMETTTKLTPNRL